MAYFDHDAVMEAVHSLTSRDFQATLNYYGMQVVKKSVLCPFHGDKHYGSCMISKRGKSATCFACGKTFDSIELVEYYEGLRFTEAVNFLWMNILGNPPLRTVDRSKKDRFPVRASDMTNIGLAGCMGSRVPVVVRSARSHEELEDGLSFVPFDLADEDGENQGVAVRMEKSMSIRDLFNEDPETALWLLKNKAREAEFSSRHRLSVIGRREKEGKEKGEADPVTASILRNGWKETEQEICGSARKVKAITAKISRNLNRKVS